MNDNTISIAEKIYFDDDGQLVITEGRPNFTSAVEKLFDNSFNMHICHSISWQTMDDIVGRIVKSSYDASRKKELISAFLDALYAGEISSTVKNIRTAVTLSDDYNAWCHRNIESLWSQNNGLVQTFYQKMFSQVRNLRLDKGFWNIRIKMNFDPRHWVHYNDAGVADMSDDNPNPPSGPDAYRNTFLLTSDADAKQLNWLVAVADAIGFDDPYFMQNKLGVSFKLSEPYTCQPVLYSSSNSFLINWDQKAYLNEYIEWDRSKF
ncbi:hypothetical protein EFT43_07005 [Leuconostoc falkenbergense]|uniref:hypothetical protein n=1 Tax=Leuconostoc falkenbergense TaxID=2766470 RepID=UPI001663A900|nr:hypothetical protein [Leuconostoc falkenbergense]MCT4404649.1 hypothetical protein [Leuconostoc falkenbergense]